MVGGRRVSLLTSFLGSGAAVRARGGEKECSTMQLGLCSFWSLETNGGAFKCAPQEEISSMHYLAYIMAILAAATITQNSCAELSS